MKYLDGIDGGRVDGQGMWRSLLGNHAFVMCFVMPRAAYNATNKYRKLVAYSLGRNMTFAKNNRQHLLTSNMF